MDYNMDCLAEKVLKAEKALTLASEMSKEYYGKPLILCYSGGKDSDVLLALAEKVLKAEDFEVLNSHTTVDAPETVYHIREVFKRLEEKSIKTSIDYHKDENGVPVTMWNLIPKKTIPPTRMVRYCCQILKETSAPNRLACLGVRADESSKRQGRDIFGIWGTTKEKAKFFSLDHTEEVHREAQELQDPIWDCTLIKMMREHGSCVVNPIYEWTDKDIWEYINQNSLKVNPLYYRGYKRVGCIGCPMATYKQKMKEFADYPTYKRAYIKAFDKMLIELNKKSNDPKYRNKIKKIEWKTGEEVFDWWIEKWRYEVKGQMSIYDYE